MICKKNRLKKIVTKSLPFQICSLTCSPPCLILCNHLHLQYFSSSSCVERNLCQISYIFGDQRPRRLIQQTYLRSASDFPVNSIPYFWQFSAERFKRLCLIFFSFRKFQQTIFKVCLIFSFFMRTWFIVYRWFFFNPTELIICTLSFKTLHFFLCKRIPW